MKIDKCEFTIFDVETTGLFPYYGDRICEIAAVRVGGATLLGGASSRKRIRKFSSLIDPRRPISYRAFLINGITAEMVAGKPAIDEVLPQFLEFAARSVLVAYNAGFDMGFLENALGEEREILNDYFVIDALALARKLFPQAPRYNLGALSRHLDIEIPVEHRALADACATWKIFEKELAIITLEGMRDVEEIAYSRTRSRTVNAIKEQGRLNVVNA